MLKSLLFTSDPFFPAPIEIATVDQNDTVIVNDENVHSIDDPSASFLVWVTLRSVNELKYNEPLPTSFGPHFTLKEKINEIYIRAY